jgi:hypothetical protein
MKKETGSNRREIGRSPRLRTAAGAMKAATAVPISSSD